MEVDRIYTYELVRNLRRFEDLRLFQEYLRATELREIPLNGDVSIASKLFTSIFDCVKGQLRHPTFASIFDCVNFRLRQQTFESIFDCVNSHLRHWVSR